MPGSTSSMLLVTNVGSGYITQRNEFVCPHAGLYVFYVAGYANNGAGCWLAIMKNESHHGTGTNMFALELEEVDTASVTSVQSGCQLYGTQSFNTFSGFRIN